ncbi:MAG: DnaK suppressor protein [Verrucomicrobiales bacterium]|jgi:DnaK suppressor protein
MTDEQRQSYRKRLLGELDQVSNEIEQHAESTDTEVDSTVLKSEDKLLEKIELALARIDEGNYGDCIECGTKIPCERLDAKPSVSLCVSCQEKKEQTSP